MDVGSIARSGLQAATTGMAVTAHNVANLQTEGYQAKRVDLAERATGGVDVVDIRPTGDPSLPGQSNVDLAKAFTQGMVDSTLFKAQTRVLKAEDEMLGATLDLRG